MIMDWAVHQITTLNLDTSTTKNRILAIGDAYEYMRVSLYMRHVRNPLRDPQLVALLRMLGINFKKPGGGSTAISMRELHALLTRGFKVNTRRGRWARALLAPA